MCEPCFTSFIMHFMSNIFKNIKYFLLSVKEKNLKNKLKSTTKTTFTNKTSKTILGSAGNVTLNSETQKLIGAVKRKCLCDCQKS